MSKQKEALKLALEDAANYIDALGGDSRKYWQALAEQETVLPGGGHVPAVPVAVYGYCPECGGAGVMRERRPNGDDKCTNGHKYPSSKALAEQPAQQEPVECQYGKGGYACCEGGPCKADEQNNAPQPAQQEFVTVPQGCVVVARSVLKKLGIDDDVIDTIARPPAQRQPLTDEELIDVAFNCGMNGLNIHGYTFARAIEAAHGIKENT